MTKQSTTIFYLKDRLSEMDDPKDGGSRGGGYGSTPGQRLKKEVLRTCLHTCTTLLWLHETLEDAEWEKAATLKRATIIYKLPNFTSMLDSCRAKKKATATQARYLKQIIFAFHDDPIDAADRLRQAIKDPLWELHNYKQLFKIENRPFPTGNDKK